MDQQAINQQLLSKEKSYLEMLAVEQGISPVTDFDALLGDFWPEGENIEDFEQALREWRLEGDKKD